MDGQVTQATTTLLEYGVLGVFLILALGAIIYLVKQQKDMMKMVIDSKDKEIATRDRQIERHEGQSIKHNEKLVSNQTRLLDLYEAMEKKMESLPSQLALHVNQRNKD